MAHNAIVAFGPSFLMPFFLPLSERIIKFVKFVGKVDLGEICERNLKCANG